MVVEFILKWNRVYLLLMVCIVLYLIFFLLERIFFVFYRYIIFKEVVVGVV